MKIKLLRFFTIIAISMSVLMTNCKKDNFQEVAGVCPSPISNLIVSLSSNPAAGGTTTGAGTFAKNTVVTVSATPNALYKFNNWTDGANIVSPNTSYIFTLLTDRTLVANFNLSVGGNCPTTVDLKSSKTYTVLAKAGISATGVTSVIGDMGVDPVTSTSITGFGLILPAGGAFSTSSLVAGNIYAPDYAPPTPANILTARLDMETAYTVANGMTAPAPTIGLGAGDVTGLTLTPGIYKWSTGLLISNPGVTLNSNGDNCGTFIFQIAQDLTVGVGAKVILSGGTQAKNIFWIVAGQATLNTTADFSGNILSKTLISLKTGAKVTGRLFAQTAVTLDGGTAVKPE